MGASPPPEVSPRLSPPLEAPSLTRKHARARTHSLTGTHAHTHAARSHTRSLTRSLTLYVIAQPHTRARAHARTHTHTHYAAACCVLAAASARSRVAVHCSTAAAQRQPHCPVVCSNAHRKGCDPRPFQCGRPSLSRACPLPLAAAAAGGGDATTCWQACFRILCLDASRSGAVATLLFTLEPRRYNPPAACYVAFKATRKPWTESLAHSRRGGLHRSTRAVQPCNLKLLLLSTPPR